MISLLDQQAISRSKLIQLSAQEAALGAKYTAAQAAQQEKMLSVNEAAAKYAASGNGGVELR